jgi:predicted MFS family arabinose efflux permease
MTTSPADLRAARRAVRLVFLVNGTVLAGWAPLVPLAQARLGLNEAGLGLVLLALGLGAILSMPTTGPLIARFGSRAVLLAAGSLFCLVLPLLPLAPTAPLLGLGLFLLGVANGAMDVSMNAHAVVVEAKGGRPVMSSIHGIFSVGGLLGAVGISLALRAGLPPQLAAVLLSALALSVLLLQAPALLRRRQEGLAPEEGGTHFALPRGPLLALGLLCCIAFLAEGSMMDWSAVFLASLRGQEPAVAGLGFALFSLAMAAGRLCGDRLNQRLGPVALLRWGAVLAASGFAVAVLLPWGGAALAGFGMIGLGVANLVPVLFSTAGRLPGQGAGHAISAVATLGYAGLLAGPAVIGFVARLTGLEVALGAVGALLLALAARAGLARP